MKASEIVNKLKDVLLSSTEKEEITTPEVELKEETPKAEEANKEELQTESSKDNQENYSTEELLSLALKQLPFTHLNGTRVGDVGGKLTIN